MPDVSIIIPAHNAGIYLKQAVDSVLAECDCDFELIIVDDRSTDHSIDFLGSYLNASVTRVVSKGPSAAAARNTGLALAKGKYIKFLDADDWLIDGMLGKQLAHLKKVEKNYEAAVSVGWYQSFNEKNQETSLVRQHTNPDGGPSLLRRNLITGSVLHQRRALERVGGFNEELKAMEEFDLHFRMALNGVSFIEFPYTVFVQRVHSSAHRLSNTPFKKYGIHFLTAMTERQAELAKRKMSGLLDDNFGKAFAYRYWEIGRCFLREGAEEEASVCFNMARKYHPNEVAGGVAYRLFIKFMQPATVERLNRSN